MYLTESVRAEDLTPSVIDEICVLMAETFKKKNIGSSCNGFEFHHFWTTLFLAESPSVLYLLRDGERVVGLLGGITFLDPLTDLLYAAEVFWRVSPEAGGKGLGLALLHRFESWAKTQGCSRIVLHGAAKEVEALRRKVGPLGYHPYQVEFLKEI